MFFNLSMSLLQYLTKLFSDNFAHYLIVSFMLNCFGRLQRREVKLKLSFWDEVEACFNSFFFSPYHCWCMTTLRLSFPKLVLMITVTCAATADNFCTFYMRSRRSLTSADVLLEHDQCTCVLTQYIGVQKIFILAVFYLKLECTVIPERVITWDLVDVVESFVDSLFLQLLSLELL